MFLNRKRHENLQNDNQQSILIIHNLLLSLLRVQIPLLVSVQQKDFEFHQELFFVNLQNHTPSKDLFILIYRIIIKLTRAGK